MTFIFCSRPWLYCLDMKKEILREIVVSQRKVLIKLISHETAWEIIIYYQSYKCK